MEHSHGALGIDLYSFGEVIDGQLVLAEVLIHETSLDPNSLVQWQFLDHNGKLL